MVIILGYLLYRVFQNVYTMCKDDDMGKHHFKVGGMFFKSFSKLLSHYIGTTKLPVSSDFVFEFTTTGIKL